MTKRTRRGRGRGRTAREGTSKVDLHALAVDALRTPDDAEVRRRLARLTQAQRMSIMYELVLADRELKGLPPPGPLRRDCVRIIREGRPTIIIRGNRRRLVPSKPKPLP